MFCVKAPRERRNKNVQHPAPVVDDCWGKVSVIVGTSARACGFASDTILCKKHFDELCNINKGRCCFPFRDCENACKGALVQCPQRFFPAFDATNSVHTGTLICQGHITLADKDERICKMDTYISPTKVGVG